MEAESAEPGSSFFAWMRKSERPEDRTLTLVKYYFVQRVVAIV